jgi:hypothetical protein
MDKIDKNSLKALEKTITDANELEIPVEGEYHVCELEQKTNAYQSAHSALPD